MNKKIQGSTDLNDSGAAGVDPINDMLHRELGGRAGKFRVSDMYFICGIEPGKARPDQISRFHSVIRALGWEFQRRRCGGAIHHVYVKGTPSEQEIELIGGYVRSMLNRD